MAKGDETAQSWEAKAAFMRNHNAIEASWDEAGDLRVLKLAPQPVVRQPGPAAQMAEFHKTHEERRHATMFASSSVKPRYTPPQVPPSVVPRAVRAKEAAAARGQEAG